MRKILYSPGYGSGWTSWEDNEEVKKLMLEWPPLVAAVEGGDHLHADHPAVQSLRAEIRSHGPYIPYLGGVEDLAVKVVYGRVRIHVYDGSESVEEEGTYEGWL